MKEKLAKTLDDEEADQVSSEEDQESSFVPVNKFQFLDDEQESHSAPSQHSDEEEAEKQENQAGTSNKNKKKKKKVRICKNNTRTGVTGLNS